MSKEFKRCPRCNTRTPINMHRCGGCGLNYDKFDLATNAEAKSAFRMGEKSRILYTKIVPSDVNKFKMFIKALLGGWFGLHHFSIGRMWRGLVQIVGIVLGFVYSYGAAIKGITSGYLGYILVICGMIWVFSFVTWLSDSLAILFNRFKYPVSLPYKNTEGKQKVNITAKKVSDESANNTESAKPDSNVSNVTVNTENENTKISEQETKEVEQNTDTIQDKEANQDKTSNDDKGE